MPGHNIIISTQNYPPAAGGIQNYMHELAVALHLLGNSVQVICDAPTVDGQDAFDNSLPFPVARLSGPKVLRRYRKANKVLSLLKKADHAILICDSWKSLELLKTDKTNLASCICIAHGMEFPAQLQAKKHQRIANTLSRADLILANSEFTAQRVTPYAPDISRLRILHPGVNPPAHATEAEQAKANAWLGEHSPILITVGRMEARKGQDKIIEIMPKLVAEHPKALYLIAGSGPLQDSLVARVKELGLSASVKFCGRVSDGERSALLQKADIFAMPCRAVGDSVEGFGIVYIEAAMLGLPSLAGRAGGAGDAVIDGHTGLLCDGDSADDIYLSVQKMLSHKQALKTIGHNAQQRAQTELQWPQIAQKLLDYVAEQPKAN
ncbi:MAG: glycosyltransferase family 4 protein [Zhongshania sp.]|uniref:glycosyltransferase family 4 protein n=1 Tax=Zhongshania sp. TaxID=1971902 RepID=UPI00262023DE|nr:glycosyltransferase family 4 protein [Zhongshania sp.]MDF1693805.1 glycosyltransferase family 4 protein [Zhongshania sp.]